MKPKIYLGAAEDGSDVAWSPKDEKNPHMLVVGTSGSGKTETLKAVIYELSRIGTPAMIIDFHQDFDGMSENVLDFSNITINPLEYYPEMPEITMYKISHILKKIFNLGVQQEGYLQDAIQSAYRRRGIDLKSTEKKDAPTFEDVKDILERQMETQKEEKRGAQTIETLLVRLRPLFNTGFFTNKKSTVPFNKIFKETTVLKLRDLPTDEVKYAVAEFFLNKLKYELYSRGKSDKLILYVVVDEAHRLIDDKSPLNDLLRESRKYGTGVVLSSQRPSDFSETVLANIGGIISFQCRLDRDAAFIAKQMGISFEEIKNLTGMGTAYVNFSSRSGSHKVKIKPLWERDASFVKDAKKHKRDETEKNAKKKSNAKEPGREEELKRIIEEHEKNKDRYILSKFEEKKSPQALAEQLYVENREPKGKNMLSSGFRKFFSTWKFTAVLIVIGVALGLLGIQMQLAIAIIVAVFIVLLAALGIRKEETKKEPHLR